MVPGRLYKIMDFAMNYSHDHREEAQAEFFAKNQTTLLPLVVWFRAPTGLDGKLKMQQRVRVYLTAERRHSNNFLQKVLDCFLAQFKEVLRQQQGWRSVRCGGSACHGKGPCDGLGEWTKTFLRDEEMKKGNHLGTSQDVFNCLVKHKQYHDNEEWEAETGIQLKAKSRAFVFVELVGVDNNVLRDMAGIKSHHCFVTCGGIRRTTFGPTFKRGWAVMAECKVDDWVLMRADVDQCKVYSEDKPNNWRCRGSFRLAQIAELPKEHATGGMLSSRATTSEGNFLVYNSQEHKQEE
ncbi:hypothetical protein VYU27_009951 [Nannochloropsis oceanica]